VDARIDYAYGVDRRSEMKKDPTIDRIRKVRHEISKKFGHDSKKMLEHYVILQEKMRVQKGVKFAVTA